MNILSRVVRIACLAVIGATILPCTSAYAGVKAKVLLNGQAKPWEIEFSGRGGTQWLRYKNLDQNIDMRSEPADFRMVEFPVNLKDANLEDRYANEQYREIVAILKPQIMPCVEYLDLPNNLIPLFRIYLRSQFWMGDFTGSLGTSKTLIGVLKDGDPAKREATIIQGLALLRTQQSEAAAALLTPLEAGGKTQAEDAWYWYAMGYHHLETEAFDPAQEAFARVIAFHTKSFEWMPAGLYAAAEGYMEAHGYDSARKVIKNIQIAYPKSQWGRRLPDLVSTLDTHETAWNKVLAQREAEAKREAELAKLNFRERIQQDPKLNTPPKD